MDVRGQELWPGTREIRMRIGELARRTGVSPRSLRYYEQQGLLSSDRVASGQRHYSEAGVERVAYLRRLFAAGLSSRTIAELLPCVDTPNEETVDDAFDTMVRERDRITATIEHLTDTRDSLDALIRANVAHRTAQAGRSSAA